MTTTKTSGMPPKAIIIEQGLVNNEYAVSRINDALVVTRWSMARFNKQFDLILN